MLQGLSLMLYIIFLKKKKKKLYDELKKGLNMETMVFFNSTDNLIDNTVVRKCNRQSFILSHDLIHLDIQFSSSNLSLPLLWAQSGTLYTTMCDQTMPWPGLNFILQTSKSLNYFRKHKNCIYINAAQNQEINVTISLILISIKIIFTCNMFGLHLLAY